MRTNRGPRSNNPRMEQTDIDAAAAQLKAEGTLTINRTYTLVEE